MEPVTLAIQLIKEHCENLPLIHLLAPDQWELDEDVQKCMNGIKERDVGVLQGLLAIRTNGEMLKIMINAGVPYFDIPAIVIHEGTHAILGEQDNEHGNLFRTKYKELAVEFNTRLETMNKASESLVLSYYGVDPAYDDGFNETV